MTQQGYVPGAEIIMAPLATLFVLITPAITTRLLAEERRLGTIELLLTAPVKDWELVVGKWLGGFFLLVTIIAITLIYPLLLNQLVDPGIDQGPLLSGYLGLILLAASMVAVGVFVSSLFSNQIAAFVTTLGALIFLWWVLSPIAQVTGPLGKKLGADQLPGLQRSLFRYHAARHYRFERCGVLPERDGAGAFPRLRLD